MREYTFARCLFCTTGKEEFVARGHRRKRSWPGAVPAADEEVSQGTETWEERLTALLPGYVFVYSDEELVALCWIFPARSTSSAF